MPYSATTFNNTENACLGNFYFHLTAKTNLSPYKVSEKKTFNSMIIVVTVSNKQFFKNNNRLKWFFF